MDKLEKIKEEVLNLSAEEKRLRTRLDTYRSLVKQKKSKIESIEALQKEEKELLTELEG